MRTGAVLLLLAGVLAAADKPGVEFQTSDRCIACHNELTAPSGRDVSIGFNWRASMMANSSRDPYWQAGVRREIIDHPQHESHIQDECSVCHMPITRYEAKLRGKEGQVFAHLPFDQDKKDGAKAADGVDCSVCHQISPEKLGTRESFNGGFVIEAPQANGDRPEYAPFKIEPGLQRVMQTSTGGFRPTENHNQIQKSELCATCHTLITTAYGPDGKVVGALPEQMPYQEWLHSDFSSKNLRSCQDCHMPTEPEPVPVTRVFGVPRENVKRHVFVAGNFVMLEMLNRFRLELQTDALPQELTSAVEYTKEYLQHQASRLSLASVDVTGGRLQADVVVENLGGHKLPTAYPSRRAWLHFTVKDRDGKSVFESGALRADGSIEGNDNDADKGKFEPHYGEITNVGQVQIYEDILGDLNGNVTTGLLTAVRFLKDNRLLPAGFDKATAEPDIAVIGEARNDPNFSAGGDRVRYNVDLAGARGPFSVEVELLYQPIGFRWANNLKSYNQAFEPRRFTSYYDSMGPATTTVLTRAGATR